MVIDCEFIKDFFMNKEPKLITDKKLAGILEELKKQELIFQHPPLGTSVEEIESMLADTFWEVGASGKIYDREHGINTLFERSKKPLEKTWHSKDFYCCEIAPNNYLLTYTILQDKNRMSRRATLWRKTEDGWKVLYHQGTLVVV
jgi:hypothetical protein